MVRGERHYAEYICARGLDDDEVNAIAAAAAVHHRAAHPLASASASAPLVRSRRRGVAVLGSPDGARHGHPQRGGLDALVVALGQSLVAQERPATSRSPQHRRRVRSVLGHGLRRGQQSVRVMGRNERLDLRLAIGVGVGKAPGSTRNHSKNSNGTAVVGVLNK